MEYNELTTEKLVYCAIICMSSVQAIAPIVPTAYPNTANNTPTVANEE